MLCASPTVVAFDGELKHDAKLFSNEYYDGVLTHVGGLSIFLELGLDSKDEKFAEMPFKDIACNKEVGDQMLTEVGGMSMFIESDLDAHREHDRIIDTAVSKEERKLQYFCSKRCNNMALIGTRRSYHGIQENKRL